MSNDMLYNMSMPDKKFTIEHDKVWQRPDQAYFDFQDGIKGVDPTKLDDGKYKALREKRDIAVFGACIYKLTGEPTFVQMNNKSDSPDAFILQQSTTDETTANIAPVEITFYGGNKLGAPTESLVDRLSKAGGKFQEKLPPDYWLLVHIGVGLTVDHQAVTDRLLEMKANFGVFSIQEVSNSPDTILRFVVYNPECRTIDVNIGEVFHDLSESNIVGTLTQARGMPPKDSKSGATS
jgi:hypothetical protein